MLALDVYKRAVEEWKKEPKVTLHEWNDANVKDEDTATILRNWDDQSVPSNDWWSLYMDANLRRIALFGIIRLIFFRNHPNCT